MSLKIFDEITNEKMENIFSEGKKLQYKKGEFLFHQGDEPESLDLLIEGGLQIFKYDSNSSEVTLNFFLPYSLIAELAFLNGIQYPASGRFFADSTILRMPMGMFKQKIENNISICHLLIQSLYQKIQILNMTISRGLTMEAQQRVAHFLYHLPDNYPPLNQIQIASMLFLRPETLSRALRQLKDLQIIDPKPGQIKILDREGLLKFLNKI
ncbi:cAMP-binding protein [Leptospira perolatii]|uniref:cAMP-binding protein n=1 Tax=Leptospira perolatii TaxID=2023191 RepID=A0A2M9ZKF8_9LEPT|nr:Crp/Fnr family transcriptional regulator [Leptospira perolatii]PJZ68134.1 cAMP-binding protein [Leptospira perolatii]PJZ72552.1 cAMP-binding protein [Leptospira perolatii]